VGDRPRWLFALYVVVAAMHLLPVWRVRLIPTVDGPSHVYNAVVLRELAAGSPEFARVFAVNPRPNPNWLGHLVLVAFPERVLFSLIVVLFLAGCWRLGGVYAFLAMPLTYHLLLQMGFYNYALGVALSLHAIASWQHTPGGWRAAVWMLLVALAHPLPAAVMIVSIAIVWLITSRRWRQLLPLAAPAMILLWFFLQPNRPGGDWTWKGALLWQPLFRMMLLFTFDQRQIVFGTVLAIVYGALIVATIAMDGLKARPTFLILTAFAIAMYLAAPVSVQEGFLLKARLLIFPYLLILPWLTPRLARWPLAVVLAIVAIGNVFYIRDCWKRNEKVMAAAIRPLAVAASKHTILALVADRTTPFSHLPFLSHVVSYAAAERRLIDLGNYEAQQTYFPVVFRPAVRRPSTIDIETQPASINVAAYDPDYVYTWKMPPRPMPGYELVASDGDARLYGRKAVPLSSAVAGYTDRAHRYLHHVPNDHRLLGIAPRMRRGSAGRRVARHTQADGRLRKGQRRGRDQRLSRFCHTVAGTIALLPSRALRGPVGQPCDLGHHRGNALGQHPAIRDDL